jgi:hypothetical protein
VAVKYLFAGSDPLSASGLALSAETIVPDDDPLPEIGAKTSAYDREWEVTRIEDDGEDTLVSWSSLDPVT